MNRRAPSLLISSLLLIAPLPLLAQDDDGFGARNASNQRQETPDTTREASDIYKGVIPGKRDTLSHLDTKAAGKGLITWIGFLPEESRTRVFIQATDSTEYQQSSEAGKIVLTFQNTKLENYNLNRFIDASHFNRAVKRIDVKRKGTTVTVTLTTDGSSPNVRRNNGYIYLDFPHTPPAATNG